MKSRALGFVTALVLALSGGCKKAPQVDPAAGERALAPVPAPEGLLSEVVIAHPDKTWDLVRSSLGGSPLVPSSPAVFLGDVLGLPVSALEQLDLNLPIVGAVADMKDQVGAVVSIHVKDGARLVDLVTAPTGRFTKGDSENGVTLLAPTAAKDGSWSSYGVSGNYLVVGPSRAALLKLAPFVTRTLPTRPTPAEDIVARAAHDAISGPLSARLKSLWDSWKQDREAEDVALRTKHGGSAPDFGDPAQALADIDSKAAKLFTILGDLEEARLAVTIEPKAPDRSASYRVLVSMKPRSEAGPAGQEIANMPVAGAEPLLALPSSVAVALLTRDNAELREQGSLAQVEAISKVLGGRLEPDDRSKIESAFQSWSKGRGDWLTAGLFWSGPTRAAVLRGAVSDPAELGRGATSMLRLLGVRAIAEPLSNWVGDMKLSGLGPQSSAADGTTQTVHVSRRPPKVQLRKERDKPAQNDAFDIVWSIGKDVFAGAAGLDAKGAYAALQKGNAGKTLAEQPFLSRTVERLGPSVSFALLVDTERLAESGHTEPDGGAFLLTYGKDRTNQGWFELDAPSAVITMYAALLGVGR
jgi:hypothetical protein